MRFRLWADQPASPAHVLLISPLPQPNNTKINIGSNEGGTQQISTNSEFEKRTVIGCFNLLYMYFNRFSSPIYINNFGKCVCCVCTVYCVRIGTFMECAIADER